MSAHWHKKQLKTNNALKLASTDCLYYKQWKANPLHG